jgi:hypothetical protein
MLEWRLQAVVDPMQSNNLALTRLTRIGSVNCHRFPRHSIASLCTPVRTVPVRRHHCYRGGVEGIKFSHVWIPLLAFW